MDEVVTKYTLDPNGYVAGAGRVRSATQGTVSAINALTGKPGGGGVAGLGSAVKGTSNHFASMLAGIISIGAAIKVVQAGAGVMEKAAEFEALSRALETVEGGADRAARSMRELQELAKAPGLGFSEAVHGYTQLRRSGLDQSQAFGVVKELGNANAMGGGGKEQLDRLLVAVSQMANKPFLQGDELLQLVEGGIPAFKLIKDIFGTADTEKLKQQGITSAMVITQLVAALSKMPRVAGGAKNTFENVGDAIAFAEIQAGSALNEVLLPFVDKFASAVSDLTKDGEIKYAFQSIVDDITSIIGGGADGLKGNLRSLLAVMMTAGDGFEQLCDFLNRIADMVHLPGMESPQEGSLADMYARNMRLLELQGQLGDKQAAKQREKDAKNPIPAHIDDPMLRTAKATEELVVLKKRQMSIARAALGGGELAAMGVSPSEIFGTGSRHQNEAANLIMRAVHILGMQVAVSHRNRARGGI